MLVSFLISTAFLGLKPNTPEPERAKHLAPLFSPPPGETISLLMPRVIREGIEGLEEQAEGHIRVNPPKGICLIIQRNPQAHDVRICSSALLSVLHQDLDDEGQLNWLVTLPNNIQTKLTWPTPHSIGKGRLKSSPDVIEEINIHHCEIVRTDNDENLVHINLFNNIKWVFMLPKQNEMVPVPANQKPNLPMAAGLNREKKFQQLDLAEGKVITEKEKIVLDWYLSGQGVFQTNSQRLTLNYSSTPGQPGVCRFVYGSKKNMTPGQLECFDVGLFEKLYLKLKCLKK